MTAEFRSNHDEIKNQLNETKEKEKILKAAREKKSLTSVGRNIRLTTDFSTETWQARKGWQDIFRVLNEKKHATKNTLSRKALIQNGSRDRELPRQAGSKRICDLQISSVRNFKGDS